MTIPEKLQTLAPTKLPVLRSLRYDGTSLEVPLSKFAPEDRKLLVELYEKVQGIGVLSQTLHEQPDFAALERRLVDISKSNTLATAQRLGTATYATGTYDPAVRKALHDVRGGGMTFLLGAADLLGLMPGDERTIRKAIEAARDHAKIMRNILPDIDPDVRAADEAAKAHGIDHFTTKWRDRPVLGRAGPLKIEMNCFFDGYVSARCLETSSIDRVVYNLVNNAVRFAADGTIWLWIFPVGAGLVRWVVHNRITAEQSAFVASATGGDLRRLFAGGITSGGNGIGMANCAEIVADSFGLDSPARALEGGYLGAAILDHDYHAWFHWPTFGAS